MYINIFFAVHTTPTRDSCSDFARVLPTCQDLFLLLVVVVLRISYLCAFSRSYLRYTLQGFIKIYKQFFPQGDPSKFASLVFRVFDENEVSNARSISQSHIHTHTHTTSQKYIPISIANNNKNVE